jgi:hypothetical protein
MKRDTILKLGCVVVVTAGLIVGTRVLEAQYGPTTPEGGQIIYNGGGIWIGQNANNGVGFFGTTPVAKQTISLLSFPNCTNQDVTTHTILTNLCSSVSNIVTVLKAYGLSN